MSRYLREKRLHRHRQKDQSPLNNACYLFSAGGQLIGLRDPIPEGIQRSEQYKPVQIGQPLLCRYMGFFINKPNAEDDEEIMISSFLKTDEEKNPSAETINFYDPKLQFDQGKSYLQLTNADTYQHELIYYTPSYLGESIKLTVKAMQLANASDTVEIISKGLKSAGQIPFFVEYLPFLAIGEASVDILGSILNWIYKDEEAINRMSLALFYNDVNWPILRSGRYVCIENYDEDKAKALKLDSGYKLLHENGTPYTESSYFVIQVDAKAKPGLEEFQYHQGAAELLALTNRDTENSISRFIDIASTTLASYADKQIMDDMEEIQDFTNDPEYALKYDALFKKLSKSARDLYRPLYQKYRTQE